MKALTFNFSLRRFAAAKTLGALSSRGFLTSFGPLMYRDVEDPTIHGDDWVLLRTRYCGICGSDVKQVFLDAAIDNPMTSLISFPHVMGHEMAGTVVEVGSRVTRVSVGDRVVCSPWLSCVARSLSPCEACLAGRFMLCENFAAGSLAAGIHAGTCRDVPGGFAPLVPAQESMCFRIPDGISFEQAVLADPFAVSFHAVHKAPPLPGETVLVYGCGPLGLLVIHVLARLYPQVTVLAADVHSHIRPLAERMGARCFLTAKKGELVRHVAEWTRSRIHMPLVGSPWLLRGVDRVYDTVGSAGTLETAVRILQPLGTVVLVGVTRPKRFEWTPLYFKEINLVGSSGYGVEEFEGRKVHAIDLFLSLLAEGRVDPTPLVTHTFPLHRYKDAFAVARDKRRYKSVKVLFDLEDAPVSNA